MRSAGEVSDAESLLQIGVRGDDGRRRRSRGSRYTATACPTSDDPDDWIKSVTVATYNDVDLKQFTVTGVADSTITNREYDDSVPGTAAAMALHNSELDKYLNGDYAHTDDAPHHNDYNFGGSETRDRWWKLSGNSDCFAMGSYQEVKQHASDRFQTSDTSDFLKVMLSGAHRRVKL